jgi:hypothetical protein
MWEYFLRPLYASSEPPPVDARMRPLALDYLDSDRARSIPTEFDSRAISRGDHRGALGAVLDAMALTTNGAG